MDWEKYFEMMSDWKKLPAYRAEPRVDSLVGYYLCDYMAEYLQDPIIGIIPELPIRLGTVRPEDEHTPYADRSYKVDFYLLGRSRTNYFVEFKTDSGSRRANQDEYLRKARDAGMAAIIEGICRISDVSSYREKYTYLINKLSQIGIMDSARKFLGATKIEIVYVQPRNDMGDSRSVGFSDLSKWLQQRGGPGSFEAALAWALMEWSSD